jgi:hypothetical protein
MQFRLLTAIVVFAGSYLPLSLILLVQNLDLTALDRGVCGTPGWNSCEFPFHNPVLAFGLFLVTLVCFGVTLLALKAVRPNQDITVTEADYVPTDLMNYTLPYVVSFMGIDYHDTGKLLGFLVFLGWMFWISHKSGQILLNPLLIALGWRLYDVTYHFAGSADAHKTKALVHGYLEPGDYKQAPIQDIQIIKP